MSKKAKSPCIDLCKMDKSTGWCRGCLRTKGEIKTWKKLSKKGRRQVLEALANRERAAKAFKSVDA